MRARPWAFFALLIAACAACEGDGVHALAASVISVEPLHPRPIRITLGSLPPPFATKSARRSPRVVPPPPDATLRAPAGFAVQVFADGLESARWLAETPDGRVLVAQSRENRIAILDDHDHDGTADTCATFADRQNGLDLPFGMAFVGDAFYLGNQDEVRRYAWRRGRARLEGRGRRITRLPGGGYHQHWTRNVVVSPDGQRLFVTVGSASNASPEHPPRATIQVMDLEGGHRRTYASGMRNPVGLAFQPDTHALYATVNERDGLGDDLVPDYVTEVVEGAFYGWPYTYLSSDHLDPRVGERSPRAAETRTPDVLFAAHSAALGLAFYDGRAFPARYRGGAFVAFRGSWNRSRGTGYEIVFVPFDSEGHSRGYYEEFVTGFLIDPSVPTTWGRPVGVLALRDGSLLFTDETGGRVYRVAYRGDAR